MGDATSINRTHAPAFCCAAQGARDPAGRPLAPGQRVRVAMLSALRPGRVLRFEGAVLSLALSERDRVCRTLVTVLPDNERYPRTVLPEQCCALETPAPRARRSKGTR